MRQLSILITILCAVAFIKPANANPFKKIKITVETDKEKKKKQSKKRRRKGELEETLA